MPSLHSPTAAFSIAAFLVGLLCVRVHRLGAVFAAATHRSADKEANVSMCFPHTGRAHVRVRCLKTLKAGDL